MENLEAVLNNEPEPTQTEKIGKLALALSKAQGAMSGANKSSANPFFKSKYADLNSCIEAARQPLADNELAVIQTTEISDIGFIVVTTLAHSSGEWIRGKISMKPKKDDDQARGSSLTYARRYAYAAMVGLAQKDDDGNDSSKGDPKNSGGEPAGKSLDAWEKEADKNAKSVAMLKAWYKKSTAGINKLPPPDVTKINSYVSQLKDILEEDAKQGES